MDYFMYERTYIVITRVRERKTESATPLSLQFGTRDGSASEPLGSRRGRKVNC